MNEEVISAVSRQVSEEFKAAFLYLALSSDMAAQGYRGAASWLRHQYHEECRHALRLMEFLEQRNAPAFVPAWEPPVPTSLGFEETFRVALQHEQAISESINQLISLCRDRKDYATQFLMFSYAAEQVEEENSLMEVIDYISFCNGNPEGLMRLDSRLACRVNEVQPTATSAQS